MLYLDYNGSAPLRKKVAEYLNDRIEKCGPYANPNANHFLGSKCFMQIEKSRKLISRFLDCSTHQIIFNSGSTEGISAVFLHTYFKYKDSNKKIILISDTEHAAPINEGKFLEKFNFELKFIPTLSNGKVDMNFFHQFVQANHHSIALVSVMAANNETGVIQPYAEIGKTCDQYGLEYLCDTTQILGKSPFSFSQSNANYITLSGHKLGALPGAGALIIKNPENFIATIHGGNQENGLRGGTQNYIGIESIRVAIEEILETNSYFEDICKTRHYFENKLKNLFPNIQIFGEEVDRICNTSFLALPETNAGNIQDKLQLRKIYVTTSSACSDQKSQQSRVLSRMNIDPNIGKGAIRISFCSNTTITDCDFLINALNEIYLEETKSH